MDLELHQLELRYEHLRTRVPRRERQLTASLAEVGQLMPVVVVQGEGERRYVLVDGYKRYRAARRLHLDTLRATCWDLDEADALLLERLMRTGEPDSPLAQGWLLSDLRVRFTLALEELARRFDKSPSWVSRRLALVEELPAEVQEHVRAGRLSAHAAMKHLVPLARAKRADCVQLAAAVAGQGLSARQVGVVCRAFRQGGGKTRALLQKSPALFVQAALAPPAEPPAKGAAELLLDDCGALGGIARRVTRRLREGVTRALLAPEREQLRRCALQARTDCEALWRLCDKELSDDERAHTSHDPHAG
jgi:ParB family chromosome partitioning protein